MPDASESGEIYTALGKVMAAVGAVGKERQNTAQNYSFRGIDDLYNAIQPALIEHNVSILPITYVMLKREERPNKRGDGVLIFTMVRARFRVSASDGSRVFVETLGEGMDSGDKSTNKAMSAAQKYAILQMLCIPTAEAKDSENDNPEPAARSQQPSRPQQGANRAPQQQRLQPQRQQPRGNPPPQGRSGPTGGNRLPAKPSVNPQMLQSLRRGWAEKFNDGEVDQAKFNDFCARVLDVDVTTVDFNKATPWSPDRFSKVNGELRGGGQ